MGKQKIHTNLQPYKSGTITKYVLRKTANKDVKWSDDSGNSPIADLCGRTSHS